MTTPITWGGDAPTGVWSWQSGHKIVTKHNLRIFHHFIHTIYLLTKPVGKPSHWVYKPAYLVPVPSQDKLGGLQQERYPA